jgi:hypothetical protein
MLAHQEERHVDRPATGDLIRILLVMLGSAVAVAAAYAGVAALLSGSLSTRFTLGRSGHPMFPTVLHGLPALLGGLSLVTLAVSIFSVCATYAPIAARLPAWTRRFRWWLFALSMCFYFAAKYVQRI